MYSCQTGGKMKKDGSWKDFFEDPARFADAINGFGCNGEQVVKEEDIQEVDTQIHRLKIPKFVNSMTHRRVVQSAKSRDMLRKVALGVNYLIIGMEPQEEIDYSLPLRNMLYDVAEYEKQAAKIRKKVRKEHQGLTPGEYMYGFKADSKLLPVVTFVLYPGEKGWTGPTCLYDMLEFTDIPANLRNLIPNYKINIISIRDIKDTSIFQTDLRYVLEFLRNAKDKVKLKKLVENEPYYQSMEEGAYDVVANYANVKKLVEIKDEYKDMEGRMNMCTAIREMLEDSKSEGRMEGIRVMIKTARKYHASDEEILEQLVTELSINEDEAREYLKQAQ